MYKSFQSVLVSVDMSDLIFLIKSALKHEEITISRAAELLGMSTDDIRTLVNKWCLEDEEEFDEFTDEVDYYEPPTGYNLTMEQYDPSVDQCNCNWCSNRRDWQYKQDQWSGIDLTYDKPCCGVTSKEEVLTNGSILWADEDNYPAEGGGAYEEKKEYFDAEWLKKHGKILASVSKFEEDDEDIKNKSILEQEEEDDSKYHCCSDCESCEWFEEHHGKRNK